MVLEGQVKTILKSSIAGCSIFRNTALPLILIIYMMFPSYNCLEFSSVKPLLISTFPLSISAETHKTHPFSANKQAGLPEVTFIRPVNSL